MTGLQQGFSGLETEARSALAAEFGGGEVVFERFAEMRYRGQRHNIKVPISGARDQAAIGEAFARDIYQNGRVLAFKKFRLVGYAYRVLLSGLVLSFLTFVITHALGLLQR